MGKSKYYLIAKKKNSSDYKIINLEDNESFKQKTLVRVENNDLFKILYNKNKAKFNNKCFYEFQVNRDIKQRLKKNIKLNRIDAFLCGKI